MSEQIEQNFDYEKYQDETTMKAIAQIYGVLGKYGEKLAFKRDTTSEQLIEINAEIGAEILNVLAENNVPDQDMQNIVNIVYQSFQAVFNVVVRQKNEYEKELLARCIGSRDPGHTDKFSKEYSTIGQLFKALEDKRIEQKSDGSDYFFFVKK